MYKISQYFDENPYVNKSSKLNIFGTLFFPKTHSAVSTVQYGLPPYCQRSPFKLYFFLTILHIDKHITRVDFSEVDFIVNLNGNVLETVNL